MLVQDIILPFFYLLLLEHTTMQHPTRHKQGSHRVRRPHPTLIPLLFHVFGIVATAGCADGAKPDPSAPALGELHSMLAGPRSAMSVCSDREPSLLLALRPPEVDCGCSPENPDGTCDVSEAQDLTCGEGAFCDPLLGFRCHGEARYVPLDGAPHCDTGFVWAESNARCEATAGPPTDGACGQWLGLPA